MRVRRTPESVGSLSQCPKNRPLGAGVKGGEDVWLNAGARLTLRRLGGRGVGDE